MDAPSLSSSLWQFLVGVLRRWYFWVPPLLLDPFDLYARFVMPFLPANWQRSLNLPPVIGVAALLMLLLWAGVLTYHELRLKAFAVSQEAEGVRRRSQAVKSEARLALEDLYKAGSELSTMRVSNTNDWGHLVVAWLRRCEVEIEKHLGAFHRKRFEIAQQTAAHDLDQDDLNDYTPRKKAMPKLLAVLSELASLADIHDG